MPKNFYVFDCILRIADNFIQNLGVFFSIAAGFCQITDGSRQIFMAFISVAVEFSPTADSFKPIAFVSSKC